MNQAVPTSPHGVPFVSGTATAPAYWALEQIVIGLGTPAARRELPPEEDRPTPASFERFTNNFWSASADTAWARRWTVR